MRDLVKIKEKEEEEEMSEMVDIVEKFPKTIFEKFPISNIIIMNIKHILTGLLTSFFCHRSDCDINFCLE